MPNVQQTFDSGWTITPSVQRDLDVQFDVYKEITAPDFDASFDVYKELTSGNIPAVRKVAELRIP